MSELAPPHCASRRALTRVEGIERLSAEIARLQSLVRLEVNALVLEDTTPLLRRYVADELALALAESPGTASNLVLTAQMYACFPAVVGRVGLPLSEGGWSVRHADALLDAITGVDLTPEQQQAVVDLVAQHPDARTPYQVRKAAQAAVILIDPEAAARRHDKAKKNRRVSGDLWADGSATFTATGTASQIASVLASLDALAGPKQPGESRTLDQRRFDAFMDLLCGRILPGQWQALIVVPLSTLEGGAEPAEIPGLGLITAEEAREVLKTAELRRAVVDDHGTLVSVDTVVHHPDLTQVTQPAPHPDSRLSLAVEPEPLDLSPEHAPAADDQAWLDAHRDAPLHTDDEVELEVHDVSEQVVTAALATLEQDLAALLSRRPALMGAGTRCGSGTSGWDLRFDRERFDLHAPGWRHGPGGPEGPHDPYDPPDPPSPSDVDWHESTQDRSSQDAQEPPPTYEAEPDSPPEQPETRPSAWTLRALKRTYTRLTTRALEPAPKDSSSYALPPRMARFVKLRDSTCTFPGCRRLARDCQSDHLDPWPHGTTSIHNLSSECVHHHQAKHACFTVARDSLGTLHWTTPLGRTYRRSPRPLLRGW